MYSTYLPIMHMRANDTIHDTIIDFNEVGMRIYLPEKVIFTEAKRLR